MKISVPALRTAAARAPWLPAALWTISLAVFTAPLAFDMTGPLRLPRLGITAVMYVLLLIKIFLLDRRSGKEQALAAAFLLCAAVGAVVSGDRWIFRLFLMIFAARDIPMPRLTLNFLVYMSAVLVLNLLLSLLGLKEDILTIRPGTDYWRHSFGFFHPNAFSLWLLIISCAAVMQFRGKKAVPVYILLAAAALLCFRYTDCRAGLAATALLLALGTFVTLLHRQIAGWKWLRWFFPAITVLVPAVMLTLTWLYTPDSALSALLDKLFTCRLSYGRCGMDLLPLTLFGNPIIDLFMPDGLQFTVDSMYVYCPLFLGIIPSLLVLAMLIRSCLRLWEAEEFEALAVYTVIIVYSTMELGFLFCLFLPVYAVSASFGSVETKRRPL